MKLFLKFNQFLLLLLTEVNAANRIRTCLIEGATPCSNNNELPLRIKNLTIFNSHGKAVVDLDSEIRETLKAPLGFRVSGDRCDFRTNECRTTPGFDMTDFCLATRSFMFQVILNKFEPPIHKCPIPKVTFKHFYEEF